MARLICSMALRTRSRLLQPPRSMSSIFDTTNRSGARFFSDHISITFVTAEGEEVLTEAKLGENLMELGQEYDLDIEAACDGACACSTCHCILEQDVFDSLEEPEEEEEDMLDLAIGLTDTSRLACQITIDERLEGARITLPEETESFG